jgi:hypothetical protein
VKHGIVHVLQKYLLNPPIRLMFALQIVPPGYALLETVGRVSGKPRRTPLGNGAEGNTFWIVTEHVRALNALWVRGLGTELLTLRIDLAPVAEEDVT